MVVFQVVTSGDLSLDWFEKLSTSSRLQRTSIISQAFATNDKIDTLSSPSKSNLIAVTSWRFATSIMLSC
jgi:hypothetical protein